MFEQNFCFLKQLNKLFKITYKDILHLIYDGGNTSSRTIFKVRKQLGLYITYSRMGDLSCADAGAVDCRRAFLTNAEIKDTVKEVYKICYKEEAKSNFVLHW